MSKDGSILHTRKGAVDKVQVSTANCTCSQPDDGISGLLDTRFRDIFMADVRLCHGIPLFP
jgi:hypothetical protein